MEKMCPLLVNWEWIQGKGCVSDYSILGNHNNEQVMLPQYGSLQRAHVIGPNINAYVKPVGTKNTNPLIDTSV